MGKSRVVWNIVGSIMSISILILVAVAVMRIGGAAYDISYRIFTEPAVDEAPGKDITVRVEKGMSSADIGAVLEEKKLVNSGILFTIQLLVMNYDDKLKPGKYTLNTSQTAKEMMQVMAGEEAEEAEE